jgi:mono/diheme cytochrome c family protein
MRRMLVATAVVCGLAASASTASADEAQVQRGIAVYKAQKCNLCHTIAGEGKKTGTTLDGVGTKLSDAEIREWMLHPKDAAAKAKSTKKPVMKDYSKLPPADLDAIVAYMKTLTKK